LSCLAHVLQHCSNSALIPTSETPASDGHETDLVHVAGEDTPDTPGNDATAHEIDPVHVAGEDASYDRDDYLVVQVNGDGRCFFRCVAIAGCEQLQRTARSPHHIPLDLRLASHEENLADRTRTMVVERIKAHQAELEQISDSLPFLLEDRFNQTYTSVADRISGVARCDGYIGYLELVATCHLLKTQFKIFVQGRDRDQYELMCVIPATTSTSLFEGSMVHLLHQVDTYGRAGHFDLLLRKDAPPSSRLTKLMAVLLSDVQAPAELLDDREPSLVQLLSDIFISPTQPSLTAEMPTECDSSHHNQTVELGSCEIETDTKMEASEGNDRDQSTNDVTNSSNSVNDVETNFGDSEPYQPKLLTYEKDKHGRAFNNCYYDRFPWMEYSPTSNAVYCFPCRVFGTDSRYREAFVKKGFTSWSHIMTRAKDHAQSNYHLSAACRWDCAKQTAANPAKRVSSFLDTQREEQVKENRSYLAVVLNCLDYLACQGLAIRGHDERESSENRGNFLELLHRIQEYCPVVQKFLSRDQRVTWTAPTIQNDLLELLASEVTAQIVNKVRASKYYSLIVDECQDLSTHSQVAVVLKYATDTLVEVESFLGFFRTEKLDGQSLSELITNTVAAKGLDIQDCVSQCYDGAAAMRGQYSGVATRIKQINPRAMYVHCRAHLLNLVLVDVAKAVKSIRNMLGTVQELYVFFHASGKRSTVLEKAITNAGITNYTMKSLSDTRWWCRAEALKVIRCQFQQIATALQELTEEDVNAGPQANGLLCSMLSFEFVFALVLMLDVFTLANVLSKQLQATDITMSQCRTLIASVITEYQKMRADELYFSRYWQLSEEIATSARDGGFDIPPPTLPRSRKVPPKLGGGNVDMHFDSVEQSFRVAVYYPILDVMIQQMKTRFDEQDLDLLHSIETAVTAIDTDSISKVCEFYSLDGDNLRAELRLFHNQMSNCKPGRQPTMSSVLEQYRSQPHQLLSNLKTLLHIYVCIACNTAGAERSFSCLRRLKNYMRKTMGQDRLSHLAILAIERTTDISFNAIIDKFAVANRRLQLK